MKKKIVRTKKKTSVGRKTGFLEKLRHIPIIHIIILTVLVLIILAFLVLNQAASNSSGKKSKNTAGLAKSADKAIQYNVFGDHFVNELSINAEQTNFYYDRATTAFTFQPQYAYQDAGTCTDEYCGLSAVDWSWPEAGSLAENGQAATNSSAAGGNPAPEEYCLTKGCLVINGTDLAYKGKNVTLPAELKKAQIINISVYPLKSDWLVGIVYKLDNKESGRAYRFNGQSFTNLDPKNSVSLESRAGFEGARFGFGGDDDNFMVLYGGYDLLGYQVVKGQITNLQPFFSLRLADGGFSPMAIKQTRQAETLSGQPETLWYICSRSALKPRLIKLWQNGSSSIKGALSLTDSLAKQTSGLESAWCRSGETPGEVILDISQGGVNRQIIFKDNGFSQASEYSLVTNNLFKESGEILSANFSDLLACDNKVCGAGVLNNSLTFSVSGDGINFKKTPLDNDFVFPAASRGLYWKITAEAKPGNADYSPWVDGLTAISYTWK